MPIPVYNAPNLLTGGYLSSEDDRAWTAEALLPEGLQAFLTRCGTHL